MTTDRASLSAAASAVARIYRRHFEGAALDAGFDAGEFSGPEHARGVESDIDAAFARLGWTRLDYATELVARTSERFAHFAGLEVDVDLDAPVPFVLSALAERTLHDPATA
jgi:hypothetical protein